MPKWRPYAPSYAVTTVDTELLALGSVLAGAGEEDDSNDSTHSALMLVDLWKSSGQIAPERVPLLDRHDRCFGFKDAALSSCPCFVVRDEIPIPRWVLSVASGLGSKFSHQRRGMP